MKDFIIIGNWKMNKGIKETNEFLDKAYEQFKLFGSKKPDYVQGGLGVPFTSIETLAKRKWNNSIVAAQNVSQLDEGAFTGEISTKMIKEVGANSVILGHSERRELFFETNEIVNLKAKKSLEDGLMPIICVGENLKTYEANSSKDFVKEQIENSLKGITDYENIIVAYEPIWAIGTGKVATAEYANEMCSFIKSLTSENLIVLYGGSVKPSNIEELSLKDSINGALVGGASLEAETFVKLLTLNK